eukprot:superscaffoldBa00004866_g19553
MESSGGRPMPLNGVKRIKSSHLKWLTHTGLVVRTMNQHLFFLRRLRRFGMDRKITCDLYGCTTERVLSGCISAWFRSSSGQNLKALQRVIKAAQPY